MNKQGIEYFKISIKVYYPIVYSEYDPVEVVADAIKSIRDPNETLRPIRPLPSPHYRFDEDTGYWREFGFGIVVVYGSDLRSVGGFNTSIVGWGKEDVDLYEKLIASNLTVFRSVDVSLVHVFHKIECDRRLGDEQMVMCLGSMGTSIASQRVLADLVLKNKEKLRLVRDEVKTNDATIYKNMTKLVVKPAL